MKQLHFAASADGESVIWGAPLPPLPGSFYVESHGIAIPAGWRFSPDVPCAIVQQKLELTVGDLALFHENGRWTQIGGNDFARATRSGIRSTESGGDD